MSRTAHILALRNRAITGALTAAVMGNRANFDHWRGYFKALTDCLNGTAVLAMEKDRASGYLPPSGLESAWARLTENPKNLAAGHVFQVLAAQGIKLSPDHVAKFDIVRGKVAEYGAEAVICDVHDEHAASSVDGNDGSGVHAGSPEIDRAIVAEGGAA